VSPTSSGKERAVKKLIKTVLRREGGIEICPESEKMSELVPLKLKKKAGKCTVTAPKAHLWKCQLDEGKHAKCERAEHDS
jgi:hypothetical protein